MMEEIGQIVSEKRHEDENEASNEQPPLSASPTDNENEEDSVSDDEDDSSSISSPVGKKMTRSPALMIAATCEPLHPLNTVGIDTDSGMSTSTCPSDFLFIDRSEHAKLSIEICGVGGNGTIVGGRGPMVVRVRNMCSEPMLLVDPEGVFLLKQQNAPDFRILAQQRMKKFGCRLIQSFEGTNLDVIECTRSGVLIPLRTDNGILVCKTEWNNSHVEYEDLEKVLKRKISALFHVPVVPGNKKKVHRNSVQSLGNSSCLW